MVYFDETGMIKGQLPGHYEAMEIYAHLYAAFFLFFASIISALIIYQTLKKSRYSWPAILGGLVYIGLIGLGEGMEHLPFLDPFVQIMAHYLHLFSAPVAVFTLYLGMKETVAMCREGPLKAKVHSTEIGMGVFAAVSLGIVTMAMLAQTPWNERIEGPFLLAIFFPTVFFVALVLWESRHFAESKEMLYLPLISIAVSILTLDIWIGRYAYIKRHASLYILTHSSLVTLLAATGGTIVLLTLYVWYSHRTNTLFVMGVSSREEVQEKQPTSAEEKKFKIDEQ